MRKLLLACAAVAMFASSSMAVDLLAGGSVPLINSVMGQGIMSLDFSSPGAGVQVAYLILNNNSQQFDLSIDAAPVDVGGDPIFQCDHLKNVVGLPDANTQIPMTGLTVEYISQGVLGDPQAAFVPVANDPVLEIPADGGDGDVITAGLPYPWMYQQQTATVNFGLGIFASWDAWDGLSGLYAETFTVAIVATL